MQTLQLCSKCVGLKLNRHLFRAPSNSNTSQPYSTHSYNKISSKPIESSLMCVNMRAGNAPRCDIGLLAALHVCCLCVLEYSAEKRRQRLGKRANTARDKAINGGSECALQLDVNINSRSDPRSSLYDNFFYFAFSSSC